VGKLFPAENLTFSPSKSKPLNENMRMFFDGVVMFGGNPVKPSPGSHFKPSYKFAGKASQIDVLVFRRYYEPEMQASHSVDAIKKH
jgi:hypothetical protein